MPWRSRSASRPRAGCARAASARRAACGCRPSRLSTSTTRCRRAPRRAWRRRARARRAWSWASAEAAKRERGGRGDARPPATRRSPRAATPASTSAQLEALAARSAASSRRSVSVLPARARRRRSPRASRGRAASATRSPRASGRRSRAPGARPGRRPAGPRSACRRRPRRRRAVDRVDADQRRVALGAPRRAHRARDAVAGDQLAAAHLRGGDVDVLVGGLGRVDAQERRAVAEHLDDALGDALGVLRRRPSPSPRSRAPAARARRRARRPRRLVARSRRGRVLRRGVLVRRRCGVDAARGASARLARRRASAELLARDAAARRAPPARTRGRRRSRAPRLGVLDASSPARGRARTRRGSRRSDRPCAGGGSRRGRAGRRSRAGRPAGSPPARSGRARPCCVSLSCGWAVGVPPRWYSGRHPWMSLQLAARAARSGAPRRARSAVGQRSQPRPRSAGAARARKSAAAATSWTRKMCAPCVERRGRAPRACPASRSRGARAR